MNESMNSLFLFIFNNNDMFCKFDYYQNPCFVRSNYFLGLNYIVCTCTDLNNE